MIEIVGKQKGPTSIILAGVHGNEVCGIKAFKQIISTLKIEKGKIIFAYGNPRAIKANVRFTEANLNRMFKDDNFLSSKEKESYEYQRAQVLKKYFDQCDTLFDIHASYTKKSNPFIICQSNSKDITKYLPVNLAVSGFDKVEPGGTDYYMNKNNKIGITIECGYLGDPLTTEIAINSILAFIKACGHITNDLSINKQSYINMYSICKTKTNNFTLSKSFNDFEIIQKGQTIGIDGKKEVKATKDSVILFARNTQQSGNEAFLLGEKKNKLK